MSLGIYAQIYKADAAKRLIYGRITDETIDRAGERMDYSSSRKNFEAWRDETLEASDGKSYGNVREQHSKIAAGKLVGMNFDDSGKSIDVVAKVVDPTTWEKVEEGVLLGFSIGGSYVRKWNDPIAKTDDGKPVIRYEAKPNEVSLVDRGCNPSAKFFSIEKADGSVYQVEFQNQGGSADNLLKGNNMNRTEMETELMGKANAGFDAEALSKMTDDEVMAKHAEHFPADDAAAADADAVSGDGADLDAENIEKNDEKSGDNPAEVSGSDEDVMAFAKLLNENSLSMKDALNAVQKSLYKPDETPLAKGLYTVGSLTEIVMRLSDIVHSVKYEEASEKDGSDLGARLSAAIGTIGDILVDMMAEEVKELLGENKEGESPVMALAESAKELVKMADEKLDEMLKAGARNSMADMARLQKMHDHSVELGAKCHSEKADTGDMSKTDSADDLKKLAGENSELKKSFAELEARLVKMESMPAPSKVVLRAVSKGDDSPLSNEVVQEIAPITKGDGTIDETATAFKKIHASGGRQIIK